MALWRPAAIGDAEREEVDISTNETPQSGPDNLRDAAIRQLRKRWGLQAHAIAYVTVNGFLTALWWFTSPGAFFWPMFPIFGWGIGLVFNVWDVYSPEQWTEDRIQREMQRLRKI